VRQRSAALRRKARSDAKAAQQRRIRKTSRKFFFDFLKQQAISIRI
jgi:hypothetical protein